MPATTAPVAEYNRTSFAVGVPLSPLANVLISKPVVPPNAEISVTITGFVNLSIGEYRIESIKLSIFWY